MVLRDVPVLGRQQDGRRQLLRRRPVAFPVRRRHEPSGHRRRPHPQHRGRVSRSGRAARTRSPTTTTSRTRSAATGASRPTCRPRRRRSRRRRRASCRSSKWTRTQSNRLLFDAGLGVYDQEYQENYQPEVFAGASPLVTHHRPAHRQDRERVEQPGRSLLEAVHRAVRGRRTSPARTRCGSARRSARRMAADAAVHRRRRSRSPTTPAAERHVIRSASRCAFRPTAATRSRTTAASSRRTSGRSSAPRSTPASAGTGSSARPTRKRCRPSTWNSAVSFSKCPTARTTSTQDCIGRVDELEGHQPAHRHRVRPVRQRQDGAQGELRALRQRRRPGSGQHHRQQQPRDDRRRHATRVPGRISTTTARRSTRTATIQLNELTNSTSTPSFGRNIPSLDRHRSGRARRVGRPWLQHRNHRQRRSTSSRRASR